MRNHTPGPWWREGRTIRANAISHIGPRVLTLFKITRNYHRDYDAADLNLAANAPDLLAALKSLLEMPVAITPDDFSEADLRRKDARAVIAKAEGTTETNG